MTNDMYISLIFVGYVMYMNSTLNELLKKIKELENKTKYLK